MDFFSCLSESISDFVKCSETDKIAGFICGERVDFNAEYVCDFISKPFLENFGAFGFRAEKFQATGVDHGHGSGNSPAIDLDVIRQFSQRAAHIDDVIHPVVSG